MKSRGMHLIALSAALGIFDACTTTGLASSTASLTEPPVTQPTSQLRVSDRMFYWREVARELHAMAIHSGREAELVLKKNPGPATTAFVKQMQLLTHQLQEAAEYADAQAKEAEQEIPPDMMQRLQSALR